MYKKIMVPLDGSKLAECVLPHVEAIAIGCRVASVTFVRVAEAVPFPVAGEGMVFSPKEWERLNEASKSNAVSYLNDLVSRIKYEGVSVKAEVLVGNAAESLAHYATKSGVDLIIIATHGRSGISRWVWGSVADRILRSACVPVLMVQGPECVPGV